MCRHNRAFNRISLSPSIKWPRKIRIKRSDLHAGGFELVGWDEWFRIFDDAGLALAVLPEKPGVLDNRHQFIKRDDR